MTGIIIAVESGGVFRMLRKKIPAMLLFWNELLHSNSFHVSFCFLSGLCCLLPLAMGTISNLEDRPLRQSLVISYEFSYACVASIALVIPLFIDVLFDISDHLDVSPSAVSKRLLSRNSGTARFNFLNISERILILFGIVILPLLVLVPKRSPNYALTDVCLYKCQQTWVGGTVALSLCRYDKVYFSNFSVIISLISFGIGLITSSFTDNIYVVKPVSQVIAHLDTLTFPFIFVPCLLFFINSLRWLVLVYFRASQWSGILFCYSKSRPVSFDPTGPIDQTFFPMIYTLSGMVVIVLICVLDGSSYRIEDYTRTNLLQDYIPYLLFVTLVSILSMRLVKFEVVQGLYALMDSKKSYVRYISHELRTPLNSAFLGLKLLTDDLKSSDNPKDADRNEILADVHVACRATVDILNDLLCFDKMESSILEVHKHEVPVLAFIDDCVGTFSAQAREGCVAMSVVTSPSDSLDCTDSGSHLSLLEGDTVFMDRFKMDQVIRNLVSNALKFTPRGGSVTVTATFVPSIAPTPECLSRDSLADSPLRELYAMGLSRGMDFSVKRFSSKKSSRIYIEPDIEKGEAISGVQPEVPTTIKGKLVIVVKDTGAGMLEEDYCRLFKEIVQFRPEVLQAGGGSGLGLWITKGIVDLHGGEVSVYSEGLGLGSSFAVELSMERKISNSLNLPTQAGDSLSEPLSAKKFSTTQRSVELSQKSGSLNLLIVDDSPLNRKMLLKTFRAAGHTCDEAEDGIKAVEKVKEMMASSERVYSAILMDFVMPNMDSPTATREIRALKYTGPIFGLTGNTLNSDVHHFLRSGENRVLAKPFNLDDFKIAIRELNLESSCDDHGVYRF